MKTIEHAIEIDVPVRTAYNQWTQFEEFPRFMESVKSVRQVDDRSLEWRASVGGKEVTWTTTILSQEPDRRIVWQSTSGATNSGTVDFEALSEGRTKVTVRIVYEPTGMVEQAGSAIGLVSDAVERDLLRFKSFLERRGGETGAWRGEISAGQTTPPRSTAMGANG